MSKVRIYHNPRCSKSRATLALLQEHGVDADVVEYLKDTPSEDELGHILDLLGCQPRELMRTSEAEYRENDLSDEHLSREQLIAAMVAHPRLIQRPIVLANGKAAIGRPPEAVLDIL